MRIDRIRRAESNVDVPAIGLPSRLARRVMVVGILNAPVVLFAEFVVGGVGIGVAAQPELLDERLALLIVAQVLEGLPFFVGNDVGHILVEPGLVGALQFLPDFLLRLEFFLVGALALQGIGFLVLAGGRCRVCNDGSAVCWAWIPEAGTKVRPQPSATKRNERPLKIIASENSLPIPYSTGPQRCAARRDAAGAAPWTPG